MRNGQAERKECTTRCDAMVWRGGWLVAGLLLFVASALRGAEAGGLTSNARTNPLGISGEDVSFGWRAAADGPGFVQSAYEIRVGRQAGGDGVWHSGKVDSARQVDVRLPREVDLESATRYFWQVRLWDGAGEVGGWSDPAWFETGLLEAADWQGAEWIARAAPEVEVGEWKDYRVSLEFSGLREAIGVLLRTSPDGREAGMWQLNVSGDRPLLRRHRKTAGQYEVTGETVVEGFEVDDLRRGVHRLEFEVSGDRVTTRLDGRQIEGTDGLGRASGGVGLRSHGSERVEVRQLEVVAAEDGEVLLARDFGEVGRLLARDREWWPAAEPASLPLLRGGFRVGGKVAEARLYASARGIYEVSCNGRRVGDQRLAPGWTDYHQRIQSQSYDVTDLLREGENVLGVALADGWFRGRVGIGWEHVYGDGLSFIAKLRVRYEDGRSEWFASGPDWAAADGPRVRADLQDGESHDARLERPGWDTVDFDADGWQPVALAENVSERLVPQPDEPVRVTGVVPARTRTTPEPGVFLYDLGQNIVGVARVRLQGRKGQTVRIRHGEEVHRTGERKGRLYTENLRSARAVDAYRFAADGEVVFEPRFTQHGFRYVEISGIETAPEIEDVAGVVLGSDLPMTGELACSSELLNQLVSNIRWGLRGNFLSIPTDTPARDERLGWTGDINVFAPAACRLTDSRAFLSKWMDDVRDAQFAGGSVPAVIPQPRGEFQASGVGWEDAVITVPHAVWRATGDLRIVRRNWDAMKRFQAHLERSATADGDLLEQGRSSWFSGDWLTLEEVDRLEEHKVIGTSHFAENTRMMAEMAAAMGEAERAAEWAELHPRIRRAFSEAYCDADGTVHTGTQTAYALALGMDMVVGGELRAKVGERFLAKLEADDLHLRTGFLGTPWLLPALSSIGRDDLAVTILLHEDYPSWGYPVRMGATTMWERWNSIQPDGSFGPVSMNSFNHYAYGAVADWMFARLAGLRAEAPGYRRTRIAPLIGGGGLAFVRGSLDTPRGRLASSWAQAGDGWTLEVVIPPNSEAEVVVPAAEPAAVSLDGEPLRVDDPRLSRAEDGLVLRLGAGTFRFAIRGDALPDLRSSSR